MAVVILPVGVEKSIAIVENNWAVSVEVQHTHML